MEAKLSSANIICCSQWL